MYTGMKEVKKRAREIMKGAPHTPLDIRCLTKIFADASEFSFARRFLASLASSDVDETWREQKRALYTYKDTELPYTRRFPEALKILEGIGLRDPDNKNSEILGLGGAVYKRMWEMGGQLENLNESLFFYRAAYKRNPEKGRFWGGINAVYIYQILASRARVVANRNKTDTSQAERLEYEANWLRLAIAWQLTDMIEKDPKLASDYWTLVTVAEALFGLGDYEPAGERLAQARELDPADWELQTTFRQLVSIGHLQGIEIPGEDVEKGDWHKAWQALGKLIGDEIETALSCYRGKVGLALSGGGFRASFYHLGVLARLAEMDVLRSVEVLSTVSGGSIVGAHYYLKIQELLETQKDRDIQSCEYIRIVRELQEEFFAGVRENIRTMVLADIRKNIDMVTPSKGYSRSHRLGELYEERLYDKVKHKHKTGRPRLMKELLIRPECGKDFNPNDSNWRRRAKVPIFLINATTLNTGHNWRFTARSMGEPPGLLGDEVDKNSRYRRLYYDQAPTEELQNFRLGYAVAASACVPGLFEPLELKGLYEDNVIRLVDGGVYDNQGVQGLLDEGCTLILCSDASGQLDDKDDPSDGVPAVLLRSNLISMDRVRETEYQDLRTRLDSGALHGLFFVHLKKDFHVIPVDWDGCDDKTPDDELKGSPIPYGIDRKLQELMANIRTDLDSFSEVEAFALMCSGYLMTEQQFRQLQKQHKKDGNSGSWGGYKVDIPREMEWPFLDLESALKYLPEENQIRDDLGKQLEVGSSVFFKIWKLDPKLRRLSKISGLLLLALVAILVIVYRNVELLTITLGGLATAAIFTVISLYFPIARWIMPEKAARSKIYRILLASIGYALAKIHLWKFNDMFLERGKLERLIGSPQSQNSSE